MSDRATAIAKRIAHLRKVSPRGGSSWFDPASEWELASKVIRADRREFRQTLNCENLPINYDSRGVAAAVGSRNTDGGELWFTRDSLHWIFPLPGGDDGMAEAYRTRYLRGLAPPPRTPSNRLRSPHHRPRGAKVFSFWPGVPYEISIVPPDSPTAADGRQSGWMIPHVVGEAYLIDYNFSAGATISAWRRYLDLKGETGVPALPSEFGVEHLAGTANAIAPRAGYRFDPATYSLLADALRIVLPDYDRQDIPARLGAIEYLTDWFAWSMGCPGVAAPEPADYLMGAGGEARWVYDGSIPSRLYDLAVGDPLTEELASPGELRGGKLLRFLMANPYPYFSLLYDHVAGAKLARRRGLRESKSAPSRPSLTVGSVRPGDSSYCESWELFAGAADRSPHPAFISDDELELKLNWLQAALYVPRAVYPFASDRAKGGDYVWELRRAFPGGVPDLSFEDRQPFAPFLLYRRAIARVELPSDPIPGTVELPPNPVPVPGTVELPSDPIPGTVELPPDPVPVPGTVELPSDPIPGTVELPPDPVPVPGTVELPPDPVPVSGTVELPPDPVPVPGTVELPAPSNPSRCLPPADPSFEIPKVRQVEFEEEERW